MDGRKANSTVSLTLSTCFELLMKTPGHILVLLLSFNVARRFEGGGTGGDGWRLAP